jgi:hypothetical protein
MRRNPTQLFLAIAISLCILASFAFGQYYIVASADFISHNLKLENFDHDYLAALNQDDLKVFTLGGSLEDLHLSCRFEQSFHLVFQVLPFAQKTSILRC